MKIFESTLETFRHFLERASLVAGP